MFPRWEDAAPYVIVETQDTVRYTRPPPCSIAEVVLRDGCCTSDNCEDCSRVAPDRLGCGWALVEQMQRPDEAADDGGASYCIDAGGDEKVPGSSWHRPRGDEVSGELELSGDCRGPRRQRRRSPGVRLPRSQAKARPLPPTRPCSERGRMQASWCSTWGGSSDGRYCVTLAGSGRGLRVWAHRKAATAMRIAVCGLCFGLHHFCYV